MKISVIIVNFNTANHLKECLNSFAIFENECDYEIIVVDNCSSDNSREIIKDLSHNIKLKYLFLDKLKSFSSANNRGFQLSSGDFILIMNPDIIFTENVLYKLINVMNQHIEIGGISPALIGFDGKFQRNYFLRYPSILQFIFFYSIFSKLFYRFPYLMNKYLENQEIDISEGKRFQVEQLPCAFFLTRRNIFEEVGMMDEKYFLFFEDVDLSYKINRKYKLIVDTSLKVTHLGGSSFISEDNWWMYSRFIKSMIYFFRIHYSYPRYLLLKILVNLNSAFILTIELVKKIFGADNSYRFKKHMMIFKDQK